MAGRSLTYFCGDWIEGNPKIVGPMTHGLWMASVVFDGARAFEGVAPDLDLHCARVVTSARVMGLAPTLSAGEIEELSRDGIERFPADAELYVRPMFYSEEGFVAPDPASTQFCLSIFELPMPEPRGYSASLVSRRRPTPEMAPTLAKASCLYPQASAALGEATGRGFDNAVMLDAMGYVAEFATANLFIGADGEVHTPATNGCFLDGITRRRVIGLLRDNGVTVRERPILPSELAIGRRGFLHRQLRQGAAVQPDRGSRPSAGAALHDGARPLLGLCPCVTRWPPTTWW